MAAARTEVSARRSRTPARPAANGTATHVLLGQQRHREATPRQTGPPPSNGQHQAGISASITARARNLDPVHDPRIERNQPRSTRRVLERAVRFSRATDQCGQHDGCQQARSGTSENTR